MLVGLPLESLTKVLFKYKSEAPPSEPICLARENKYKNRVVLCRSIKYILMTKRNMTRCPIPLHGRIYPNLDYEFEDGTVFG